VSIAGALLRKLPARCMPLEPGRNWIHFSHIRPHGKEKGAAATAAAIFNLLLTNKQDGSARIAPILSSLVTLRQSFAILPAEYSSTAHGIMRKRFPVAAIGSII
jgi:hypothetical protein